MSFVVMGGLGLFAFVPIIATVDANEHLYDEIAANVDSCFVGITHLCGWYSQRGCWFPCEPWT